MKILSAVLACALVVIPVLAPDSVLAQEYDKKALKKMSKTLGEYEKGSIFQKSKRVAIVGPHIAFRVAAKQDEDSSWKSRHWVRFSAIAQLQGVDDALMQEITDEYRAMVEAKMKSLGLEVVPYAEMTAAKSWSKLAEGATASGSESTRKNWGVAKTFSPQGQSTIIYDQAKPFGAHRKLPKELDAILYNSAVNLDFAEIGVDVTSSKSDYSTYSVIYTEGKSSIVPKINVASGTFSVAQAKKGEHNLRLFTDEKAADLGISSPMAYAQATEKCSPCELDFSTGGFIKDNTIDIVNIVADRAKFKAAALDALSRYLDATVALYTR